MRRYVPVFALLSAAVVLLAGLGSAVTAETPDVPAGPSGSAAVTSKAAEASDAVWLPTDSPKRCPKK